jgi:serine/threonine protein kinase
MAENYEKVCKVGEGSFGMVYKYVHVETREVFAIKKIRMGARHFGVNSSAIDEIHALQVANTRLLPLFPFLPWGIAGASWPRPLKSMSS